MSRKPRLPRPVGTLLVDVPLVTPSAPKVRPPGQRLYDLPYSALAPRLVNPALGLHNLVARSGEHAPYEIDVTLLDAPDHRLIRSGVLLAHRVLDGRGEWFLTAPEWRPLLPKDRVELMGDRDLPEELADMVRPLRRRSALGPVAALRCERREFALRDDAQHTLALLRDDKVTVRRGGLTTARYREVRITPVGPGLTEEQTGWLERAFLGAGATEVAQFPRLVARLGSPATGGSDLPAVEELEAGAPLRRVVGQLLAARLRGLVEADLAVRSGEPAAALRLEAEARRLAVELAGLAPLVADDWRTELADEVGWLLDGVPGRVSTLASRLRSERYLALLDRLVTLAKAPRLGAAAQAPAGVQARRAVRRAVEAVDAAVAEADLDQAESWAAVSSAMAALGPVAALLALLDPAAAVAVDRRLAKPRDRLGAACAAQQNAQQLLAEVAALSPQQAFETGRTFEREAGLRRAGRERFVHAWRSASRKLARELDG